MKRLKGFDRAGYYDSKNKVSDSLLNPAREKKNFQVCKVENVGQSPE
jgi:hypothetical protein